MENKVITCGSGTEATVFVNSHAIILGINGKSSNPDRHAITLTPDEARRVATMLNAAADLS